MTSYKPIDADNHYYETLDAFTRHLDPKFRHRGVQVVQAGKRVQLIMGGRVNRFIPNPTFDPIIVPGCLDPLFRGQIPDGVDPRSLMKVEPLADEYRDKDKRADLVEAQGLDSILLFPTLGCGVEQALKDDIDATMASLHAFNRWLEEDWGFNYRGRLISAPMISLADPAAAVTEIDSLIERGARIVHVRPAPVPAENGTSRSLGDKRYDPVWARLAEASIPVAFHLGDSGYEASTTVWGGSERFEGFGQVSVLTRVLVSDRAIHDTIASLVIDGVFTRHPTLRVASIENGSDWVALLVKRLRKQANQTPWTFTADPLDTIREHVWVTPYYEEDLRKLADLIGVERILFGSDWPHGEGLAEPTDFYKELDGFTDDETRKIMRDNCLDLLGTAGS
ncbi:Amidohydrolase [Parafrankia irregularis]|uniref:Amidohydrolase n=1 Tax=Parafrankia irregularis TaxID=795642 RepID=A0A0S4QPV7_9ACTN|nr:MULTISPECIES: amidohydrolase family protein [Parafrankia]MBE3201750.1 amidohydrolase family protein [Parafrankia sp. CH37]CUU57501.1 Amidohydrolase [Parafrankia irregularis]